MSTAPAWVGLRLDPLDTLFFRDARPFDAATRATGGLPTPQTLAGAVRTALLARTGFDFAGFAGRRKGDPAQLREALKGSGPQECWPVFDANFRGPWLALAEGEEGPAVPLLPLPETLRRAKGGGWSVTKPVRMGKELGWDDPDALLPVWREVEADPKVEAEWLTLGGLTEFLGGGLPDETECMKRSALTEHDHRVGIEIDKDKLSSADGMLYVISLLATNPKHGGKRVCLYAEIELPETLATLLDGQLVPFGGEGKYVQVRKQLGSLFNDLVTPVADRNLWYLATPTFFPPTGRPLPKPKNATLIAAASGAGVAVSGWDVARNGPKPTRFAVPAGAVYFVEGQAEANDFLNLGETPKEQEQAKDFRQEGWGFALPGTWEGSPQ